MKYLLTAEVDKIQSFIFRSSKLREVIGASYMLVDFCNEIGKETSLGTEQVLTSAGGSFRLVFGSEQAAREAGEELRQRFEAKIGGSITVAPPVPYDPTDPKASIAHGGDKLREAKSAGRAPEPVWNFPFQAICQSCGIEYAQEYKPDPDDPTDTSGQPFCQLCQRKAKAARQQRRKVNDISREDRKSSLIGQIFNAVESEIGWEKPDDPQLKFTEYSPYEAETYAGGDGYIAYLAADGNRMGAYFGRCQTPEQAIALSKAVDTVTTQALAEATHKLIELRGVATLPFLPLIFGGDDLLVLVPGTWAVDIARLYAVAYEQRMSQAIIDLENGAQILGPDDPATVGVGVVVCKSSYPFRTAHHYAEHLLDRAKDHAKDKGQSAICADVILGSSLVENDDTIPPMTTDQTDAALAVRAELAQLSNTKRQQIKSVRAAANTPQAWQRLQQRLQRIDRNVLASLDDHEKRLGEDIYRQVFRLWDFTHLMDDAIVNGVNNHAT